MEDILDVYQRPFDSNLPLVCMDEKPIQLLDDAYPPLPATPSRAVRYDYEYKRNGTASLSCSLNPWEDGEK